MLNIPFTIDSIIVFIISKKIPYFPLVWGVIYYQDFFLKEIFYKAQNGIANDVF
jgi:hypothetical protein